MNARAHIIPEFSAEWFTARVGILTASLLSEAMRDGKKAGEFGKPFYSLVDLVAWSELAGQVYSGGTGFAAQRGIETEPLALKCYAELTGFTIHKPGFLMHPRLKFGATPDAIATRPDGKTHIVEVKCPETPGKIIALRCDGDVSEYRDQIQGQLMVTGAEFCDLVIYDPRLPPDSAMTVLRVDRDAAHISRIEKRVEAFTNAVQQRVEQFRKKGT